jgi:hypothetical protein
MFCDTIYSKRVKPVTEGQIQQLPLYKVLKTVKLIEAKNKMVVTKGCLNRRGANQYL